MKSTVVQTYLLRKNCTKTTDAYGVTFEELYNEPNTDTKAVVEMTNVLSQIERNGLRINWTRLLTYASSTKRRCWS